MWSYFTLSFWLPESERMWNWVRAAIIARHVCGCPRWEDYIHASVCTRIAKLNRIQKNTRECLHTWFTYDAHWWPQFQASNGAATTRGPSVSLHCLFLVSCALYAFLVSLRANRAFALAHGTPAWLPATESLVEAITHTKGSESRALISPFQLPR